MKIEECFRGYFGDEMLSKYHALTKVLIKKIIANVSFQINETMDVSKIE